jgi:methylenetetrahydrofolate dehydrogenase (NADP+)/methenyltetrahydrofolate cyclohydrolase/formyltetrahydrofolate synthetase
MFSFYILLVLCPFRFSSDTQAEMELVQRLCMENGAFAAVSANHWAKGGAGATDLGNAVIEACKFARANSHEQPFRYRFLIRSFPVNGLISIFNLLLFLLLLLFLFSLRLLYPLKSSIKEKIETICTEIYGAAAVEYSEIAETRIKAYTEAGYERFPICMAKTQYSLSTDASKKGVPTGFTVKVRDIRAAVGAGYIYPICGMYCFS